MNTLTLLLRQEFQPRETRRWLENHNVDHPFQDRVTVQGYFDHTKDNASPYYKVSIQDPHLIIIVVGDTTISSILSTHFQYPLAYQQRMQREQSLRVFKIILSDLTDLYYLQTLDSDLARLAVDTFPVEEDGGTHR